MKKCLIVLASLILSGCGEILPDVPGTPQVILIRDGQMETSGVYKFGGYCWVAWYHGIEHIILKSDGTANDPPFQYRWEPLNMAERGDVLGFFKRNGCLDVK